MEPLRRQPLLLYGLAGILFALLFSTALTILGEPTPFFVVLPFGIFWAAMMWVLLRGRR